RGVEAQRPRIVALIREAFDSAKEQFAHAGFLRLLPPDRRRSPRRGEPVRAVDEEKWPAVHPDVPPVPKRPDEPTDMGAVVLLRVLLLDQDCLIQAVPAPRPVFVGPAEAEGEVRLSGFPDLVQRPLQQAPAVEPVMVVAEAVDAVLPRQLRLGLAGFR